MSVYAVIHTGGKQYRVSPGDVVRVEKLTAQPGDRIELDQVYLLAVDGRVTAGNPVLKNARVVTEVLDQDRGKKIIVFKHRRRKGYRKTTGHRQYFTELRILDIMHEGVGCREQPEKQLQSQKEAVVATAPVPGKAGAARRETAASRMPESRAARETKQEKQITGNAPAPRQPEKPKPAEQSVDPVSRPHVRAAAPGRYPQEAPPVPTTPSPVREKAEFPVRVAEEEQPRRREQEEKPSSGKRGLWWIIGAVIASLALLGLVLLTGSNHLRPRPENRQEAGSKPAREKQGKAKPPVRDVKTKETVRVDKPAAPAQPPD